MKNYNLSITSIILKEMEILVHSVGKLFLTL